MDALKIQSLTHSTFVKTCEFNFVNLLAGYIDWITQAEELAELEAEDQQNAIKVMMRTGKMTTHIDYIDVGWSQLRQTEQHCGRATEVSHAAVAAGGGR